MTPPASLFATPAPPAAVEIGPRFVSAITTTHQAGVPVITAHATEPLPPGAVTPTLNGPNVQNPEAVAETVKRVFDKLGGRPRRVALVVPDSVAKVSLVRLEKVPPRAEDLRSAHSVPRAKVGAVPHRGRPGDVLAGRGGP